MVKLWKLSVPPHRRRYPEKAGLGRCSFCSTDSEYVQTMHSGPGELCICADCLKIAQDLIAHPSAQKCGSQVQCSFCSKAEGEVDRLVAGPSVYICNECVRHFRNDPMIMA